MLHGFYVDINVLKVSETGFQLLMFLTVVILERNHNLTNKKKKKKKKKKKRKQQKTLLLFAQFTTIFLQQHKRIEVTYTRTFAFKATFKIVLLQTACFLSLFSDKIGLEISCDLYVILIKFHF